MEGSVQGAGRCPGVLGGRDRDERGADDPVAQLVAAADLVDDLAFGATGAGHADHGLVLAGIERGAGSRVERADALALEEQAELAVDRGDALGPRVVGQVGRPVLDRPVEVVGQLEHLADEVLTREAELSLALLGGPALEVRELGALALEGAQVLVRLGGGLVAGGLHLVELGDERARRDVELLDALLGAGLACHRSPGLGGHAYRWSISSFINPLTNRTVPIACGYAMRVGPRTPTTPTARPGRPYGASTSETSAISSAGFSEPMNTRTVSEPATPSMSWARYTRFSSAAKTRRSFSLWANSGAAITLSRPSLNSSSIASPSNSCRLLTIRSPTRLWRATVRSLVSRRARTRSASSAVRPASRSLRNAATALSSAWSVGSSSVTSTCFRLPSRRTRMRLASRSLIDTRSRCRRWAVLGFAGVASPAARVRLASVVAARRNQCSLAYSTWPNWWRIISCSTGGSGALSMMDST